MLALAVATKTEMAIKTISSPNLETYSLNDKGTRVLVWRALKGWIVNLLFAFQFFFIDPVACRIFCLSCGSFSVRVSELLSSDGVEIET